MQDVKLIDCGTTYRILYRKDFIGIITNIAEYWQIQGEQKIYKSQDEAIAILIARSNLKTFYSQKRAGSKGKIIR